MVAMAEELRERLPYGWKESDTCLNDQRWLNGIIDNAAPFSDWWTKARIVQLAYEPQFGAAPKWYQGKTTVTDILEALYQEIQAYCRTDLFQCQQQYQGFFQAVDEAFVVTTLNAWKGKQFTQAIGRNFEVYAYVGGRGTERSHTHTFLVVSTASVSLSVRRQLPNPNDFRPLFNVDELAQIVHASDVHCLTLRTHGYANPAQGFFNFFAQEADRLFAGETESSAEAKTLSNQHFYIGYHWPSEQPILNAGLFKDTWRNWGISLKFLGTLLLLSLIPGLIAAGIYDLLLPFQAGLYWLAPLVVFVSWLVLFGLLRSLVYQRDRYRAIHYGAPDLAEFFWRLDKGLKQLQGEDFPADAEHPPTYERKRVNLIGHSMGGLVLVNMLRVLSDRFGKDDRVAHLRGHMGDCLSLGKLILASPDLPLELLREGRNNYVRSAIRRCEQIYLLSSDRDTVLRYLSTLGNWFSEPSVEMSGLRLGNVYLSRGKGLRNIVLIRAGILPRQAVIPTSAYDLFESFNYLDCSLMVGVNGTKLSLNPFTALLIDGINTLLYLIGNIDVHGGYFRIETPTFKLLPFLIQTVSPTEAQLRQALDQVDPNRQIRFLPSTPIQDYRDDATPD